MVLHSFTMAGLTLESGDIYYVSVRSRDIAGNMSEIVSSDGVTVDLEGPVPGTIVDSGEEDNDWSNSTTTLSATWDGFNDDLSGIERYEYAIGTGTENGR